MNFKGVKAMYRAWVYDLYTLVWDNKQAWKQYLAADEELKFHRLLNSQYDNWRSL